MRKVLINYDTKQNYIKQNDIKQEGVKQEGIKQNDIGQENIKKRSPMTNQLFLIFNHSFSEIQEKQAIEKFNINHIVEMPEYLKKMWRQIPAEADTLKNYLIPFKQWLAINAKKDDLVLIQGDFGASFILVEFVFKKNLVPIYATTFRRAEEKLLSDGTVKLEHVFQHCRFRHYEQ